MVGRAGAGALATVQRLNILHLNSISLLVTGVSTALVTVLCTSYASMLVYGVVFGLSVGTYATSLSVKLVVTEYIGPVYYSANSITSICYGFEVVQQIHNILTCRRTCDQHNKRGDASVRRTDTSPAALVVLITSCCTTNPQQIEVMELCL